MNRLRENISGLKTKTEGNFKRKTIYFPFMFSTLNPFIKSTLKNKKMWYGNL